MLFLLGATGYIGQAFARELTRRNHPFLALTRAQADYTRFEVLLALLRQHKPSFLINAAGYTGKPNVDACELAKADTLQGNAFFPQTLSHACAITGTPWGHVSSGCIYSGAKVLSLSAQNAPAQTRTEKDLSQPHYLAMAEQQPQRLRGFTEEDEPNFTFRQEPCSFYSGTKALGEEVLQGSPQTYLWRLRIPFDEWDNPRNYLTKLQTYPKVYNNVNSISHRADYVAACLDLWERNAPAGTYNITNPGFVTTRQVVELLTRILRPARSFEFWSDDAEFYQKAAKTPRSNCILDTAKLEAAGIKIRPVAQALEDSLHHWKPEKKLGL